MGIIRSTEETFCIADTLLLTLSVYLQPNFSLTVNINHPSPYSNPLLCLLIQRHGELEWPDGSLNMQLNGIIVVSVTEAFCRPTHVRFGRSTAGREGKFVSRVKV